MAIVNLKWNCCSDIYNKDSTAINEWAVYNDYMMPVLETALTEDIHMLIGEVVICGVPVGAIIELGRMIGNAVYDIDDLSKLAATTIAFASVSDSISTFYLNQLGYYKDGEGNIQLVNNAKLYGDKVVAYSDFSENLCKYLNDICIARIFAEDSMREFNNENDSIKQFCDISIANCEEMSTATKNHLLEYYSAYIK